jgi:hypothetical protein
MTTTGAFDLEDMPSSETSPFAVVLAIGCIVAPMIFGAFFAQRMQAKVDDLEMLLLDTHRTQEQEHEHVNDLFVKTESLATKVELNAKKEYDPDEELEEGVYQAWYGFSQIDDAIVLIQLWREKEGTYKANKKWMDASGVEDASCIVRDFYLGNGSPEFQWGLREDQAAVSETMVNGWSSVVRLEIRCKGVPVDQCNQYLKSVLQKKLLHWSRSTITPSQAETVCIA